MTREKYNRLLTVARDIVRAAEIGQAGLDPLTIEWAQDMLRSNAPKAWPTPARDQLLRLWDEDLLAGLTCDHIAIEVRRPVKKVREMCAYLVKAGTLFQLGGGRGRRNGPPATFFISAMARDQAKPKEEPMPLKIPRLAKTPRIDLARRATTPFNPTDELKMKPRRPIKTVLHSGEAFKPDHVVVQHCPSSTDTRYTVNEPVVGGYADEWKRLRGEA